MHDKLNKYTETYLSENKQNMKLNSCNFKAETLKINFGMSVKDILCEKSFVENIDEVNRSQTKPNSFYRNLRIKSPPFSETLLLNCS